MTKTNLIDKIGLIIQSNNTADAANTIANIMVGRVCHNSLQGNTLRQKDFSKDSALDKTIIECTMVEQGESNERTNELGLFLG